MPVLEFQDGCILTSRFHRAQDTDSAEVEATEYLPGGLRQSTKQVLRLLRIYSNAKGEKL
jgi:hypothetical protein